MEILSVSCDYILICVLCPGGCIKAPKQLEVTKKDRVYAKAIVLGSILLILNIDYPLFLCLYC